MCGICGLVATSPGGSIDSRELEAMNVALQHRGPDEGGTWLGDGVGLGARRLSILDLERGQQPMLSEDERIIAVFNGEIYNFQELRNELEGRGARFATRCDTEVVLRAYEAYGDDALNKFNGMFAIAIFDRNEQRLLVARDPIGIKPLFYTQRDGVLAFSSELDSLLHSGRVRSTLNAAALDAYFTYLYIPAPDTIFSGVHKLCPGEKLIFEKGELRVEPYWKPSYDDSEAWTLDSAAERYAELLQDAVRMQMISDVPIGAFLSGGIDSTSVVACMSRAHSEPINTFTIGFDDPEANELPFAKIAAESLGCNHREEIMRPDLVELLSDLQPHFGEPFADSSAIPTWLVSTMAREHVTVVLSGDGGDELFGGYTWMHMNHKVARYRRVPKPIRSAVQFALSLSPSNASIRKLLRFSQDSFLTHEESFRRRETCFSPAERGGLYTKDLGSAVSHAARDRFQEHIDTAPVLSDDDWMLHQDLRMYLPDDVLTKVDRMSMAASLEARVPLLDHRIVEFAGSVPFHLKYEGGVSKRLVKTALSKLVPAELLHQRKRGFAIPIQRWFRRELAGHFTDMTLSTDSKSGAYIESTVTRQIFESHRLGQGEFGHHLWTLLVFEHWLRYLERVHGLTPSLE